MLAEQTPGDINQDTSVPAAPGADGSQATAQGAGPDPGAAVWLEVTAGLGRESSRTSPGPLGARPLHGDQPL